MSWREQFRFLQSRIPEWLVNFIGIVVLLLFGFVFYLATVTANPGDFQEVLTYFLTTVNGMLAANLGALVGITVAATLWRRTDPAISWFQIVAAIVYALFLVWAWIAWWKADLTDDPNLIVVAIPTMCRTGLGIVLGIFSLALGVQRPKFVRLPIRPHTSVYPFQRPR